MKFNFQSKKFGPVEIEGNTQVELFQKIADFQEVFDEPGCGSCKSDNYRFSVREVDDNKYYELVCNDCGCKLSLGQNKKGGSLFPKRKDNDGNWDNKNKGWNRWKPTNNTNKDITRDQSKLENNVAQLDDDEDEIPFVDVAKGKKSK